jgi:homogentisate 1,2-dioxygenase
MNFRHRRFLSPGRGITLFHPHSPRVMSRDVISKAFLSTGANIKDYIYQTGFGNRFSSEAVPNVLPKGINTPQRVKYDLYSEQLNGSSFIASRRDIRHVWMYRIRPSTSHGHISTSEMNTHVRTQSCHVPASYTHSLCHLILRDDYRLSQYFLRQTRMWNC